MKNNIFKIISLVLAVNLSADSLLPSEAYKLALENSNAIKSLDYQLKGKKEDINQVEAQLKPMVNLSLSHSKVGYELNNLQARSTYDIKESSTDLTLSLKQTLYDSEINHNISIEKLGVELFESKVDMEKQDLALKVFSIYLTILDSKSKIRLLESMVDLNTKKLTAIQKKFNIALSNKIDLLQAKVELNKSQIDLDKQKKIDNINILKLKQIISIDNININVVDIKSKNAEIIDNINSFINNNTINIDNSLKLQHADLIQKLSRLNINAAKAAYYPKLNFDIMYTKYSSDDYTSDYENYNKIMLTLNIPIYQGGRTYSKIKSAELSQKSANEDVVVINKELKIKHDELKSLIKASLDSVNLYNEAINSTNTYLESVTLGYDNGLRSSIELYDAKDKLLQVEYEYNRNFYELLNSYMEFLIVVNRLDKLEIVDKLVLGYR